MTKFNLDNTKKKTYTAQPEKGVSLFKDKPFALEIGRKAGKPKNSREIIPHIGKRMAAKTFEKAIARLEEIVRNLEEGELTLGDSLKVFEEGMVLSRFCSDELESAEKKVTMLEKESGKYREVVFDMEEEGHGG